MPDFFNPGPIAPPPDPDAHKAKHDAAARKYQKGLPGFWSQIADLLIAVAVLAVIVGLFIWIL
ncbi:hypothetical protein [Paenibacillus sp. S150]|uniref:hypothetical protein n=1 Tax=Paenibacillus sp. S150 TaxID=2749826 RepID=UPI001C589E65|nr:hypothetical protein [Paenibacillus sp. S150]MBW4082388.1 hypothetical protein [Paenibacillus sp. S150]